MAFIQLNDKHLKLLKIITEIIIISMHIIVLMGVQHMEHMRFLL